MVAAAAPDIVLIEEPETNLSWSSQPEMAQLVRTLAANRSVVASTHSPLMTKASPDGHWLDVKRIDGRTVLKRTSDLDQLRSRFTLPASKLPPRPMRLLPARMIQLHDDVVQHLRADAGEILFYELRENHEVRLTGEKSMNEWLSPTGAEDDE